jgi:hypothetical protein
MAVQIRQEINILDHSTIGSNDGLELVGLDTTQYNGTVTYYFEIVASNSGADASVVLRRSNGIADDATITVSGSTVTLYRSSSFTPGYTEYYVIVGANITVKSARIVIIQNATTLTNTETQIEIGNYNTGRTAEAAAILTNPKYWKYDASKWDGTKTFYAEAVYDSGDMDTISVYIYESAAIDAPSWSSVATIVSAATTTVPTRTRVAFTPTDGRYYTIFSLNGSMDNHDIYRAGIVVDQNIGSNAPSGGSAAIQGGTGTTQAQAQSFTGFTSLSGVVLTLAKTGTPADNLVVDLVSTLDGSSLATVSIAGSSLTTTLTLTTCTFTVPATGLTAGNTYYIQLTRSGARDTSNYYRVSAGGTSSYSGGAEWVNNSGSWTENSYDFTPFTLQGDLGITKLEPQYLLANTLFAAGTALQTFLTKWDSTEWTSVTNTYYFQAEAANNSTSDVTLNQADGGGAVTNSTLTNIDNAQISAAMTMPGDENLDVTATTNAGDVAAARILVTTVVSTTSGPATVDAVTTDIKNPAVYTPGQYYSIKNIIKRLVYLFYARLNYKT